MDDDALGSTELVVDDTTSDNNESSNRNDINSDTIVDAQENKSSMLPSSSVTECIGDNDEKNVDTSINQVVVDEDEEQNALTLNQSSSDNTEQIQDSTIPITNDTQNTNTAIEPIKDKLTESNDRTNLNEASETQTETVQDNEIAQQQLNSIADKTFETTNNQENELVKVSSTDKCEAERDGATVLENALRVDANALDKKEEQATLIETSDNAAPASPLLALDLDDQKTKGQSDFSSRKEYNANYIDAMNIHQLRIELKRVLSELQARDSKIDQLQTKVKSLQLQRSKRQVASRNIDTNKNGRHLGQSTRIECRNNIGGNANFPYISFTNHKTMMRAPQVFSINRSQQKTGKLKKITRSSWTLHARDEHLDENTPSFINDASFLNSLSTVKLHGVVRASKPRRVRIINRKPQVNSSVVLPHIHHRVST